MEQQPDREEPLSVRLRAAVEKLGKWRSLYAGWWFGTRSLADGQARAARDNFDRTIMVRVELNALTRLLLANGVIAPGEWQQAVLQEAQWMDAELEKTWPGFSTFAGGLRMDPERASQTMTERGFPQ